MQVETRDVFEAEIREVACWNMEEFGTLDSSEKRIAMLGDRRWPQAAKHYEDKISIKFLSNTYIYMETT
ncbi:hypothetical protein [Ekhidna sp.]